MSMLVTLFLSYLHIKKPIYNRSLETRFNHIFLPPDIILTNTCDTKLTA